MPATYHHGHLRQALIDAAVEVARERGPEALAVRDLARRVGVSHNAAYRHFAGREDIVSAVSHLTMQGLVSSMTRRLDAVEAVEPVLRSRLRLAATGRGYVDFAQQETGLFKLAFAATDLSPAPPEADPYGLLGRALDDLVDVGFLSPEVRPGAEVTCWSAVHGFAVLTVEGPLRGVGAEDRDAALLEVLTSIDRSYAATTGATVLPEDLHVAMR